MAQLHLDLAAATHPHDAVWAFGGGVCHAAMLLRADVRRQLMICRDELGFRHVACRGILADDMCAAGSDGSFSFDKIEQALDWLLENGMVPFLRLAPPAIEPAGGRAWLELVKALATHVDGRYGCDAREWYFEIVGPVSEQGPAGATPADGFDAYDAIVDAIKQVHPEYRVGWHVPSQADALDRFLVPTPPEGDPHHPRQCDFITMDGRGEPGVIRQKLSAARGQATPLFVIGSAGDGRPEFAADDCNRAAFIARTAVELSSVCQGIIARNISDIDAGPHRRVRQAHRGQAQDGADRQAEAAPETDCSGHEPFHGGDGLITVNDIRKGAFNALHLLHEHGGYHCQRLEPRWTDAPAGLGCLATRSESTLRLLFWLERQAGAAETARFTIEGIPESAADAQIDAIRPGAGSPFEAWARMGKPQFVNREVLDALELASLPAQATVNFRQYPPRLEPGMVMQLTINLPFDEVA